MHPSRDPAACVAAGDAAVSRAYVDDFVFALGDRKVHVEESAASGRTISSARDLVSAGFRWHHVCEPTTTAYDLAVAAVEQLSQRDRLGLLDAIVYSTCLPLNGNVESAGEWDRTRDVKFLMDFPASRLQVDFSLGTAVVVGLNQQACTAMLGSLGLARALLATETQWERVLCVTADRFPAGALYEQAYNLISDGAAACVVTRAPAAFEILATHHITNGALGRATDDETVGTYFNYTHRLVDAALSKASLTPTEIDWVVPQNTNERAWTIMSRLLGIPAERVWFPTIADVGHVISADNVVNLAALVESGRLRPGDRVLLVMAGFGLNYQCVILEATDRVAS